MFLKTFRKTFLKTFRKTFLKTFRKTFLKTFRKTFLKTCSGNLLKTFFLFCACTNATCTREKMAQWSNPPSNSSSLSDADVSKATEAIKYLPSLDLLKTQGGSHSVSLQSRLSDSGPSSSGSSRPGTDRYQHAICTNPCCYCASKMIM